MEYGKDAVTNAIYNGIKRGIAVCLKNQCYGAAATLLYCGIDTMAYLSMPEGQQDVRQQDFVDWAERYIRLPCQQTLTGLDLYGARCAILHTHGAESRLSRERKCRQLVYADRMSPEVIYNPGVDSTVVMVSLEALVNAFFLALDKFLIDLFSDREKAAVAESRLNKLLTLVPFKNGRPENGSAVAPS